MKKLNQYSVEWRETWRKNKLCKANITAKNEWEVAFRVLDQMQFKVKKVRK